MPRHFERIQLKENNSECSYKQCNTVAHKNTLRGEVNDREYKEKN
jgi:hypothetical protein